MTKLEQTVTVELSKREALYLKTLVGFVVPSGLPHAQFVRGLYDNLNEIIPETVLNSPWSVTEYAVKAIAVDWNELA